MQEEAVTTGFEWSLRGLISLPDVEELFTTSNNVSGSLMDRQERSESDKRNKRRSNSVSLQFHEAVLRGDVDTLSHMLSHGADPDQVDGQGRRPLEVAIGVKTHDVARLLLRHGASPNAKCSNGMFLLQNAAYIGDNSSVDLLLEFEAAINIRARPGPVQRSVTKTPLAHAVQGGHFSTARLIISRCPANRLPALLNAQDMLGQTPLHQVALCRQYAAIGLTRTLLDHGSFVDAQDKLGRTPLFYASESGNREMVRVLVHHHASLVISDVRDQTITGRARSKGHIHVAKYLERKVKAMEAERHVTCLFEAGVAGSIDGIKQLVLAGALVNMRSRSGLTVLHGAAKGGHLDLVRVLVNSGASLEPDESQESPSTQTVLNMAAESGNWDVTEFLLDAGGNPNASLLFFRSPAFHAAQAGRLDTLAKLSSYGCQMDQAIIGAAKGGHLDVMEYLLEQGISIDTRNRMTGLRSIDCALLEGHFHFATCLLKELGVSLNVPTGHGDQYHSTLHYLLSKADDRDTTNAVLFVLQHGGKLQAVGDPSTLFTSRPFNCPELLWNITHIVLAEKRPLSLKNNCRLTIRQSLHGPQSSSVQSLPLPSILKSYLLFQY